MPSQKWVSILEHLHFAFQPIVGCHDGECLGHECLLRGYAEAGFSSIQSVFDCAHGDGELHAVDLALREKAMVTFTKITDHRQRKFFYNLDNRVLSSPGYSPGATKAILERLGLTPASICFEVSERHSYTMSGLDILSAYHDQGYSIAIDDYGVGFSGLKRLFQCETDYIKIDGFFLADIATSNRKRLFVSHIVGLAHILGIKVIAEQVETESQFWACKGAGCDFIQGYLVAKPATDVAALHVTYDLIHELNRHERRAGDGDKRIVSEQIEYIEPLPCDASMAAVLEAFRKNPKYTYIPVVNTLSEPLGIIWEPDIKEFVYSRYGRELMLNPSMKGHLLDFVTRCPLADVTMGLDKMLEVFSNAYGAELLLLTEGSKYRGFLSASALLVALNDKNLAIARDQNPLSRLPGNSLITGYVGEALRKAEVDQMFVYFDLDNFKVFNDVYGFRLGDRAILLLADTLREASHGRDIFVGHIGGDDFFAGFAGPDWRVDTVCAWARGVVESFNRVVLSLFAPEDRARGFLVAADRSGVEREVPLLSVSCAILALPTGTASLSQDTHGAAMARGKKAAKLSPDKMHVCVLGSVAPRIETPSAEEAMVSALELELELELGLEPELELEPEL